MTGLVKNTFLIIGTLVASLLIFYLAFGDPGRNFMWSSMSPVFEQEWQNATWKEGNTNSAILNEIFEKSEDISAT